MMVYFFQIINKYALNQKYYCYFKGDIQLKPVKVDGNKYFFSSLVFYKHLPNQKSIEIII